MKKIKEDLAAVNKLFRIDDRGPVKHLLGVHIKYNRETGGSGSIQGDDVAE